MQRGELRLDGAKVKVRRLAAQRTPLELKDVRRELYRTYPRVQFPDLIMAVDAETHFSAEILGSPADNETELLHLYAGILDQSMDLSANRLSLMVRLTPEGLAHAMPRARGPGAIDPRERGGSNIHAFARHCAHGGKRVAAVVSA